MNSFVCVFCNKIFSKKFNLSRHLSEKTCKSEILQDWVALQNLIFNIKQDNQKKDNQKKVVTKLIKTKLITHEDSNYYYKKYTMPSGKIINYQGYENFALDELLQLFNENDIENERYTVPIIKYIKNNKEYNYFPDIFIKSKNLIIEVKSEWTYKLQLIQNILKALAVRKAGYNFEFWIYNNKKIKIII